MAGARPLAILDNARIDLDLARESDIMFLLVCTASFIESGADTYSGNLARYFADDEEVVTWLRAHWEPEELQHGRALRAYVRRVWPDFDWEAAYRGFFEEYSKLCLSSIEPTRAQEMAGRCVVEMGTTTYYQTLAALTREPVLRALVLRIRADEIGHYKHFYAFFRKYVERERLHRPRVLTALIRRVIDIRGTDGEMALRHAIASRFPHLGRSSAVALSKQALRAVRIHYPALLAVRMTLKPLRLSPRVQRGFERVLAAVLSQTMLR
ncbi:MAG TPA: ferritin-like domain-containing protein [Burkholderiaceae bacterium]|nr:ferritin-like domain-containing protein [Burkholderiaceae bacterium]